MTTTASGGMERKRLRRCPISHVEILFWVTTDLAKSEFRNVGNLNPGSSKHSSGRWKAEERNSYLPCPNYYRGKNERQVPPTNSIPLCPQGAGREGRAKKKSNLGSFFTPFLMHPQIHPSQSNFQLHSCGNWHTTLLWLSCPCPLPTLGARTDGR